MKHFFLMLMFFFLLDSDLSSQTNNFAQKDASIFTIVEQMPKFPGGDAEMSIYLGKNITYPSVAKQIGIEGTVFITFVVEPTGAITEVRALRGFPGGLTEEATRVVEAMPRWQPGLQNNIPVRVQCTLPIKFILKSSGAPKTGKPEGICMNYGRDQMNKKNYTDAIIGFNEVIKINPQNDEAYYLRAKAHLELKQNEEACKDFGMIKSSETWNDISSMKGKVCK